MHKDIFALLFFDIEILSMSDIFLGGCLRNILRIPKKINFWLLTTIIGLKKTPKKTTLNRRIITKLWYALIE